MNKIDQHPSDDRPKPRRVSIFNFAKNYGKHHVNVFICIILDIKFDYDTPGSLSRRFRDELASPTSYRDRNWLQHTIKRRDIKKSIADSESMHLEVSGTGVTFLFR